MPRACALLPFNQDGFIECGVAVIKGNTEIDGAGL